MAKNEQQELTPVAIERITKVIRSLADDRVERGLELSRPMHCDNCDSEKPAAGSSVYGSYKLCNDCLLDFTLALASGSIGTVADYMIRRTDDVGAVPPSDLSSSPDRNAVPLKPLHGRDKLMPSNEPC